MAKGKKHTPEQMLIPLFAIGACPAFTLSQAGMVIQRVWANYDQ
jgi:hypothetical protein